MAINFVANDIVVTKQGYIEHVLKSNTSTTIRQALASLGNLGTGPGTVASVGNVDGKSYIKIIPQDTTVAGYQAGSGTIVFFESDDQLNNTFEFSTAFMCDELSKKVLNNSGATIPKGSVVRFTGLDATTQLPTIALASAAAASMASVAGVTEQSIPDNGTGSCLIEGGFQGLDTSMMSINDIVYLSDTPGQINNVSSPGTVATVVGTVHISAVAGSIVVRGEHPFSGAGGGGSMGATGIAGPMGMQGVTGITGLTGMQGNTGLQGNTGTMGVRGMTGVQGIQGTAGTAGAAGATGVQGIQGDTGIQGNQGATGIQGLQGNQGQTGVQGLAGGTGILGQTGVQGLTGGTGVQGQTGAGSIGDTGIQGDTGIRGNTGSGVQGDTGIQGQQGNTGTGIQGDTGIQGPAGMVGATGVQGLQGDTGLQGGTGIEGETGVRGQTGIMGAPAQTGATGIAGGTGVQGTQGDTGIQGQQGNTGTGVQGATGVQGIQGNTGFFGETGIQGNTGIGAGAAGVEVLASAVQVDAVAGGGFSAPVFSTTGSGQVVTRIVVRLTGANGLTSQPTMAAGWDPSTTDVFTPQELVGVTAVDDAWVFDSSGKVAVKSASGETLLLGVTGAAGNTGIFEVDVLGYNL